MRSMLSTAQEEGGEAVRGPSPGWGPAPSCPHPEPPRYQQSPARLRVAASLRPRTLASQRPALRPQVLALLQPLPTPHHILMLGVTSPTGFRYVSSMFLASVAAYSSRCRTSPALPGDPPGARRPSAAHRSPVSGASRAEPAHSRFWAEGGEQAQPGQGGRRGLARAQGAFPSPRPGGPERGPGLRVQGQRSAESTGHSPPR